MRISLRTKTIVGVAIIEIVLLMMLVITAISFLTDIIDETLTKRANTTASLFATTTKDALLGYDLASLDAFTEELMENPDIAYVKVIGQDEQLFSARGDPSLIEREFKVDHQLNDVIDGIFDTSASIIQNEFVFGRIELGISIQPTQEKIVRVQTWSGILAFIELMLVAAFSYILGSYLTRQLRVLNKGSHQVKKALKTGDFLNVKVAVKGDDELSDLARSFNSLTESLQQELQLNQEQKDQLQALNNQLEQKVAKRTGTLNVRNKELLDINNEMKETQQQLLQAEKMASVGQLAAGVAHEINNPIGFVSSNLSTLKDYVSSYQLLTNEVSKLINTEDSQSVEAFSNLQQYLEKEDFDFINQDVSELIEESEEGLQRVSEIVGGLKLFSRIDNDEKQLFDLNACLKTTLNMVKNELKYDCDIETDFQPLPTTAINVGKLNQVFTNLLINAGQAIKSTGKFGLLSLSTSVKHGHIVIRIKDTGVGMSEEVLHKIFNPFFTTKPEGSGTGLGLSISFGIIVDHGGELIAESKEGAGSCFIVKLPITIS